LDKNELNQNAECPLKRNLMKSVLDLNIHFENSLKALLRRPRFKVSCFKFQVFSVSEKELQCMNVNILWRGKAFVLNNRGHFWNLL
jgi:hypothetical protein